MSQKELANRMRKHGFKWSQATVWAIEKGERPLRLTESMSLGEIFGIDGHALSATRSEFDRTLLMTMHEQDMREVAQLASASFNLQRRIAVSMDEQSGDEVLFSSALALTAVDYAMEGLARAVNEYRVDRSLPEVFDGISPEPEGAHVTALLASITDQVRTLGLHVREETAQEWSHVLDQAEG